MGHVIRVLQILVVVHQLQGPEHSFVDHDPTRQRADVEHLRLRQRCVSTQKMACVLSDQIELALKGLSIDTAGGFDQKLLDMRLRSPRRNSDVGFFRCDRHDAPADESLTMLPHQGLDRLLASRALFFSLRQEDYACAEPTRFG